MPEDAQQAIGSDPAIDVGRRLPGLSGSRRVFVGLAGLHPQRLSEREAQGGGAHICAALYSRSSA